MMLSLITAMVVSPVLWGCAEETVPEGRVESDVRFLADDLLLGRATPSHGLDVAALYLVNQLRAAGWEPGMEGSYLQPYEVGTFDPSSARYDVSINGVALRRSDYVFLSLGLRPEQTPIEFDLVFAGWGVSVPEQDVDDFAALDVAGKGVVAFLGAPWELDPAVIHAPDHAIGKAVQVSVRDGGMLLYVSDEFSATPPAEPSGEYGLITSYSHAPLTLLIENARASAITIPILSIGPDVFDRVLGHAVGGTYEELQSRLAGGEAIAGDLEASVRIEIDAEAPRGVANNVVAVLPGSDAAMRDEWVLLTAHYDHVGSFPVPPGEDGICNGADDNASGTATVLEAARRLATEDGLKRSLMVVFTSGEEMGLLGSAHYAAHPLAPLGQTVVNINVDMVGRSDGTVQALTPGSDDLFQKTVEFGAAAGLSVLPDQQPTWRLNYFLDSYHAARAEIPLVSLFTALHEDYHLPTDEVEKVRFGQLEKVVALVTQLAEHYAEGGERPGYLRPEWFLTPSEE
jgi:hypothetical protein